MLFMMIVLSILLFQTGNAWLFWCWMLAEAAAFAVAIVIQEIR